MVKLQNNAKGKVSAAPEVARAWGVHTSWVSCLASTPDLVASGGTDGCLVIMAFSEETHRHSLWHSGPVTQARPPCLHAPHTRHNNGSA